METVSYVWVNNSANESEANKIPCEELSHGLKNIISNAEKTPGVDHVLYLDRLTNGDTVFDSTLKIPGNVKFKTVDSLFVRAENLMRENDVKDYQRLMEVLKEAYNAEMEFGRPAYAGNFPKLLAIYLGEMTVDIGVKFEDRIVKDLNFSSKPISRVKNNYPRRAPGVLNYYPKGSPKSLAGLHTMAKYYTTSIDPLESELEVVIRDSGRRKKRLWYNFSKLFKPRSRHKSYEEYLLKRRYTGLLEEFINISGNMGGESKYFSFSEEAGDYMSPQEFVLKSTILKERTRTVIKDAPPRVIRNRIKLINALESLYPNTCGAENFQDIAFEGALYTCMTPSVDVKVEGAEAIYRDRYMRGVYYDGIDYQLTNKNSHLKLVSSRSLEGLTVASPNQTVAFRKTDEGSKILFDSKENETTKQQRGAKKYRKLGVDRKSVKNRL